MPHTKSRVTIFAFFFSYVITAGVIALPFFLEVSGETHFPHVHAVVLVLVSVMLVKNFTLLVVSPWHDVVKSIRDQTYAKVAYFPKVSVIIPAWNEEVGIVSTIDSVLRNTYEQIEVVVVDDGSTDGTGERVQEFLDTHPEFASRSAQKSVRYIRQENSGKGAALNCGIRESSGEIVITVDADCVVHTDAIEHMVRTFRDPGVSAVMGRIAIGNTSHLLGVVQSVEYLIAFHLKKAESVFNAMYVVGGAAAAYRRSVLEELGGFDTRTITEDIDLSIRILDSGKKIVYVDDALVYTEGANTLGGFIKQRLRWRRGKYDALVRHRRLFFSRERRHSKALSHGVLPLALFSEITLALEPFLVVFIIVYGILTLNFISFITLIALISFIVLVALLVEKRSTRENGVILLAPIVWVMFYIAVFVEYIAFVRSLWSIVMKKEIKWQRWDRRGVLGGEVAERSRAAIEQAEAGAVPGASYSVLRRRTESLVILSFLVALVLYFYMNTYGGALFGSALLMAIFLAASTDGLFLSMHLFRRPPPAGAYTFDPEKLTVVIICYNGEDIIGETIRQALTKVPARQIIVVSDNSTDGTVEVAGSYGVRVFQNDRNYNKALSINLVSKHIETPYTLILDDDTHIEKTLIPTSLLDEGYSAVAFNVMPEKTSTLANALQMYEYRKSMYIGKYLRSPVGAIGNISGAIGLFRTEDIVYQSNKHSGQFGGEDQQRTMLVHLQGKGRGVAYTDSTVYTEAPDTLKALFKQRAFKWSTAVHENFFLCVRILFSSNAHYLLKAERAYLLFIFLTDPIRIILFPLFILYPTFFLILYGVYLLFETSAWVKTGRKDPFLIVLLSPPYNMVKNIARFIAHFYWFKMKYQYVIKNQYHRLITGRRLLVEYSLVTAVLLVCWSVSASMALTHKDRYTERMTALGKIEINTVYYSSSMLAGERSEGPEPNTQEKEDMLLWNVTARAGREDL